MTTEDLPASTRLALVVGGSLPGEEIPSLDDLAERAQLSRVEVVRALEELEGRRAVERVPGSGRLVARRVPYRVGPELHASMTEGVRRSGRLGPDVEFRTLIRRVDRRPAPDDVADVLELEEDDDVLLVVRERVLDDEVVVWGRSWLPSDVVGDLEDELWERRGLSELLEEHLGGRLRRRWYHVELELPPLHVSKIFGHTDRELAWWIESANDLGQGGHVVELSQGWLRADVFRVLLPEDRSAG
ncbi:MAG: GntR family transcriptional regulator [Actinomycetota bacterium]